jgi:hypothetical protein
LRANSEEAFVPIITEEHYRIAAETLGCEVAAVKAVVEVESAGRGVLPDGRPTILYEAHIFDRLTRGAYRSRVDRNGVALSSPRWNRSLYGRSGAHQYNRLEDAAKLAEKEACFACSWGPFQIMGFHYPALGFTNVNTIRDFIVNNDEGHEWIDVFVKFILLSGLDDELQRLDWAGFARGYNGPAYRENRYDEKMAAAYVRHRRG